MGEAYEIAVRELERKIREWQDRGWIPNTNSLPAVIIDKIHNRRELFSARFDPFRLAVEHEALRQTRLEGLADEGRASYVRFTAPDEWIAPEDQNERQTQIELTQRAFAELGIAEAGIIRGFSLCQFTFGYTRIGNRPVIERSLPMPVRLCLFPTVTVDRMEKNPVYVLRQHNEAIYVRLDPAVVREWLEQPGLDLADAELLAMIDGLGGALLASAPAMSRYLERHDHPHPATLYEMAHTLLHSAAHHVMHGVAHLSGLDVGSLGEYLFPADLAFVIYRNGLTMDLGNLSALWRNNARPLLDYLRDVNVTLGCNLGSLCLSKGGACPDCLMIPEVTCLTRNKYLSRSVLIGRGRPSFLEGRDRIAGYFHFAHRRANPDQFRMA
jgi:hypothetical protein